MSIIRSKFSDVDIPLMAVDDFIMEHFDCYGDSIAMVDGIRGHSYTYNQIKLLVRNIRSGLASLGFKEGDVLAIFSPNCPEYALIVLAVLNAGGVVTTLNPSYTTDELLHVLTISEAKYLITITPLADKVLQAKSQLSHLKEIFVFGDYPGCTSYLSLLENFGESPPRSKVNPDDVALILYSSGTTGLPKGVMLTHRSMVSNMCQLMIDELLKLSDSDQVMALLPFFHIYAMNAMLMQCLRQGVKMVTLPKFMPQTFLQTIQVHKISVLYIVPPLVLFLAQSPLADKYNLSSVRSIVTGAAPIGVDLLKKVAVRLRVKNIAQGYGLTEVSAAATIVPKPVIHYGSVGQLLPQTEMKIVDVQTGELLGPGQDGEIWVRGPQIMKGYLKNPEATANCIDKDRFLHTGDIGHIDEDGFLWIVDRLKELIKYKGFQVAPAELEALLLSHPDVLDAAVIGVPDQVVGEIPRAFVVRKTESLTGEMVSQFVRDKTSPHKWLRGGVVFVKEVPKSASGKILRKELRKRLQSPSARPAKESKL